MGTRAAGPSGLACVPTPLSCGAEENIHPSVGTLHFPIPLSWRCTRMLHKHIPIPSLPMREGCGFSVKRSQNANSLESPLHVLCLLNCSRRREMRIGSRVSMRSHECQGGRCTHERGLRLHILRHLFTPASLGRIGERT